MRGDNDMMGNDTDIGTNAVSGFADAMALIKLAQNPAALQAGLDALMAAGVKANESKAAAARAEAKLEAAKAEIAALQSELDKREADLEAVEKRWQARMAACDGRERRLSEDGQRRWLLERIEHAKGNGERIRRRVVHLSGIRPNLNEALQSLPDWDAIIAEILPAGDPHFDPEPVDADNPDLERETVLPANAVAGSSLRQTRTRSGSRAAT
jgi:hypothetical protein